MRRLLSTTLAVVIAGLWMGGPAPAASKKTGPGDDLTVIAVIDSGITPYHWDFLASRMPQHTDKNKGNDIPLHRPPHEWLAGFPSPNEFANYDSIDLTLEEKDGNAPPDILWAKDRPEWEKVQRSDPRNVSLYWMPGTKVMGVDFGNDKIYGPTSSHGTGASSVAVGNIHGSCPECLLVFIDTGGFGLPATEDALEWAESQPWIDAVNNSYGHSTVFTDNVYSDSDTEAQRKATERGQTVFFAAHNGHDRSFFVPNNTLLSSQPGPDWIVTVGAVAPTNRASYTGHGKPADISGIGLQYPSAYGSPSVSGEGTFGGTSNATPVVTGLYGRALYQARLALAGPSRMQQNGVVAKGPGVKCASKRPDCELGDGVLTAAELRTRFFHGAIHTDTGMTVGTVGAGSTPVVGEEEFINEGHGTYFGLLDGPKNLAAETARIFEPMLGLAKTLERPAGELEWMIVDSFCRQHLWGAWKGGYFIDGKTDLPGPDASWPLRTSIEVACPVMPPF